jgi:tRNA (guanosine-2'-O-)-methyltransferase
MQILATHLSDKAVDFREIDYTRPTCILMGQEKPASLRKRWRWPIRTSSFR